jgi:hypothetical protein
MLLALFSKPWWKTGGKDDPDNQNTDDVVDPVAEGRSLRAGSTDDSDEGDSDEGASVGRPASSAVDEFIEEDLDDDAEVDGDDDDETQPALAEGELTEGIDDPLAPGYDLEFGEPIPQSTQDRGRDSARWKTNIDSAKDFFATELLYRFDILEPAERGELAGTYRIELRGYKGGVWTLNIGDDLEVLNRREEAEVVLAMQQHDFLQLVNGQLNPQLAILSQKVKIQGDIHKITAFNALLSPDGH